VSSREALARFVRDLEPAAFYVSREAADQAWRQRGLFNVVDLASGWKIDLILRKERAFSRSEFDRRMPARILGVAVHVATAEDTIGARGLGVATLWQWARAEAE
jgi:hypothetical protein